MAGDKPTVAFGKGEAPFDKWNIIKLLCFYAGFAVIFPSSALTASSDLYNEIFGDHRGDRLLFYIGLAAQITSPFVQIILQHFQSRISYSVRIMTCCLANSALAGLFPFVLLFLDPSYSFPLVIFMTLLIGLNNAVLKLSFFSLTSYYPARFQQDGVFGKGLSPVLVVSLKMAVKFISETKFPDDKSYAIRRGSVVFFSLAALVPFLLAVLYRYARKTSLFSKHYFPSFRLRKLMLAAQNPQIQTQPSEVHPTLGEGLTANQDQDELHLEPESPLPDQENDTVSNRQKVTFSVLENEDFANHSNDLNLNVHGATNGEYVSLDDSPEGDDDEDMDASLGTQGRTASSFDPTPEIREAKVDTKTVLVKVSLPAFILALSMTVTYVVYPAIMIKSLPTINVTRGWFKLFLMMTFAVSDFVTRSLPYSILLKICPVTSLDVFAYARLIFIPLFAYSAYISTISSQLLFVFIVLFGFSNGLIFVVAMRNYSHLVADYERSTAGSILSIAVVVGVLSGNLIAILIDTVANL